MPPRKPAAKAPQSDMDSSELIISYLRSQNRPYSATDITSNLHNKVSKTKTDKFLKEMFERSEIDGKVSGKQWVYWCLQEEKDSATPEELAFLDTSITSLREIVPLLKSTLKAKSTALAVLRSEPTTRALQESVESLEKQRNEIRARLEILRSGSVKPVSEEEKKRVESEHKKWAKNALMRKRMWKEAEDTLLEAMTKEELYDKLGIDEEP